MRGDIAVAPLKQLDGSALPVTIAAEMDRSQLPSVLPLLSTMPDSFRFALVAAEEALLDAGLLRSCQNDQKNVRAYESDRIEMAIGVGMAHLPDAVMVPELLFEDRERYSLK